MATPVKFSHKCKDFRFKHIPPVWETNQSDVLRTFRIRNGIIKECTQSRKDEIIREIRFPQSIPVRNNIKNTDLANRIHKFIDDGYMARVFEVSKKLDGGYIDNFMEIQFGQTIEAERKHQAEIVDKPTPPIPKRASRLPELGGHPFPRRERR